MPRPVHCAFAVYVLLVLTAAAGSAQDTITFRPVLEAILHGDLRGTDMPPLPANSKRVDVQSLLSREATLWISAGPQDQRDRRRAIAALVALRVANVYAVSDWPRAYSVLEWACKLLRRTAQPAEVERLWHWAAIALTQAAAAGSDAEAHAAHASARFPEEPRFTLARAVALELQSWPDPRQRSPRDRYPDLADRTIERFRTAAKHEHTRAEANVRLGFFLLRHRHYQAAIERFREAGDPADPYLRYFRWLLEGRAHDREGRLAAAVDAYRRALIAAPGAQTAELALASALARSGRQQEAHDLARSALVRKTDVSDPWLSYGQADLRFWPSITSALEAAIR
jgi:tetratricopeptide (TPR) repeat protein